MVAVFGLLRRLAQQVLAHAEGAEQLVVEVVAVGQHDQGRVLHRRVLDDLPGVEGHQQALAGALRVPDHADLAIAAGRRRRERALHRVPHGVELVVAREDLDDVAPSSVAEDDEILEQVEQAAAVEHALEQRLQFRRALGRDDHRPSTVRHGMNRSRSAVSEPMRAAMPSEIDKDGVGAEQRA